MIIILLPKIKVNIKRNALQILNTNLPNTSEIEFSSTLDKCNSHIMITWDFRSERLYVKVSQCNLPRNHKIMSINIGKILNKAQHAFKIHWKEGM